jgi:hypothetical protein
MYPIQGRYQNFDNSRKHAQFKIGIAAKLQMNQKYAQIGILT